VEILQQTDLWTIHFGLRTAQSRQWVTASWHPQAARIHLDRPVPKAPDPFQFSHVLQRLRGLALCQVSQTDPWERVLEWQFASRPSDPPLYRLYLEIMGKHSNIALVDTAGIVVACGRGISDRQSSVRPLQPGLPYQPPPALVAAQPSLDEPFERWRERLVYPASPLQQQLLRCYRGLSRALVQQLAARAGVYPTQLTDRVTEAEWQSLFEGWQDWLLCLDHRTYRPGWTATGYTVLGWSLERASKTVDVLVADYYREELQRLQFDRDRHRLKQKLQGILRKLYLRQEGFQQTLDRAGRADEAKRAADLLMAHLQDWQPGLRHIELSDFETGKLLTIDLDPEKTAIANAQLYYKKHRKQKRAQAAVLPLLRDVQQEIQYLEQVYDALDRLEFYRSCADLQTLREIDQELIEAGYLPRPNLPLPSTDAGPSAPHCYRTPNGFEVRVGRNNRQNDWLAFKLAQNHDWWLHAQEIPGSHVLLRLPPGAVAEEEDLQTAANLAAFYSRARLSDRVPVVYIRPKYLRKLKGYQPGMVTYDRQEILWADPHSAAQMIAEVPSDQPS
jgi:predicted ribosome quality control (RQC) complex YloA/Tae2 family protein